MSRAAKLNLRENPFAVSHASFQLRLKRWVTGSGEKRQILERHLQINVLRTWPSFDDPGQSPKASP